jgi:hypothetical protein
MILLTGDYESAVKRARRKGKWYKFPLVLEPKESLKQIIKALKPKIMLITV